MSDEKLSREYRGRRAEREERCPECNGELSCCGEMTSDGPSLDCEVCQLRTQLARVEGERDEAHKNVAAWKDRAQRSEGLYDGLVEGLRLIPDDRPIGATSLVYEKGIALGSCQANWHWREHIEKAIDGAAAMVAMRRTASAATDAVPAGLVVSENGLRKVIYGHETPIGDAVVRYLRSLGLRVE